MTDTITKQEPKLSVRKPGAWRNRYWYPEELVTGCPLKEEGPGQVWGDSYFTTETEAREVAKRFMSAEGWQIGDEETPCDPPRIVYLGPVFFPEGDDQ